MTPRARRRKRPSGARSWMKPRRRNREAGALLRYNLLEVQVRPQGASLMPIHDWTRVEAGIFHAFHHEWISEIGRALNRGLLPAEYYALPEQIAAGFGPDVLTLQDQRPGGNR